MTACPGCGSWWHAPGRLGQALWAIGAAEPEVIATVPDLVIAVLDRWCDGADPVISSEAKRRREDYLQLADQFTGRQG